MIHPAIIDRGFTVYIGDANLTLLYYLRFPLTRSFTNPLNRVGLCNLSQTAEFLCKI
jgi:hypothetical protein